MGLTDWARNQIYSPEVYANHRRKYGRFTHFLFQFSLVNSALSSMPSVAIYFGSVLVVFTLLLYHLYCYVQTMINAYAIGRPDMSVANVHSVILAFFVLSSIVSFLMDKEVISEIENRYGEKLFVYDEDEDTVDSPLSLFEKIMTFVAKRALLGGAVGLFLNVYISAPIMDSRYFGTDCLKRNINFCTPLPMYEPYDSSEGWRFGATIALQCCFGIYRISVFIAVQTTLLLWPLHLIRELSNLKLSIQRLEFRIASKYSKITKKTLAPEDARLHYSDKLFNDIAKYCLHENVKHHQNIIAYFNNINAILQMPAFLAYMTGTMTMAVAMVKLLTLEGNSTLGGNIAYATIIGAEVNFMVLISVIGQSVTDLASEVFDEISHIRIERYDLQFRKSVLIFMEGTLKPIAMTSSKFNKCNMEAFGNVINAAYSFFQVVSASQANE